MRNLLFRLLSIPAAAFSSAFLCSAAGLKQWYWQAAALALAMLGYHFLWHWYIRSKLLNPGPGKPRQNIDTHPARIIIPEYLRRSIAAYRSTIQRRQDLIGQLSAVNSQLELANTLRGAMVEITQQVIGIDDLESLFQQILEKTVSIFPSVEMGTVMLLQENRELSFAAAVGFDMEKLKWIKLPLKYSFLFAASRGKMDRPCIIEDVPAFVAANFDYIGQAFKDETQATPVRSTLTAPIRVNGELYGMINLDSSRENAFGTHETEMVEYLSSQIGVALNNHELLQKTHYLSKYDRLTGLINRSYFEEMLPVFFQKSVRYSEKFTVVSFDLNNLKQVNDSRGHSAGDKLLAWFASSLQESLRSSDLIARYGGDEFVAVLFDANPGSTVHKMDELSKMLQANPVPELSPPVFCSFSYGIGNFPIDGDSLEQVMRTADQRMYAFKRRFKEQHQQDPA